MPSRELVPKHSPFNLIKSSFLPWRPSENLERKKNEKITKAISLKALEKTDAARVQSVESKTRWVGADLYLTCGTAALRSVCGFTDHMGRHTWGPSGKW